MGCYVSVILPRLPEGVPLVRTLNSIRRQTLKDIEIISAVPVSLEISAEYGNIRVYKGLNEAIANANGEYIYFMHPEGVLSFSALKLLHENSDADTFAVSKIVQRKRGEEFLTQKNEMKNEHIMCRLISNAGVHACLFNKELLKKERITLENEADALTLMLGYSKKLQRVKQIHDVLVYIDGGKETAEETIDELIIKSTNYNRLAEEFIRNNSNYVIYPLFTEYVKPIFQYFEDNKYKTEAYAEIINLFESLHEFCNIIKCNEDVWKAVVFLLAPLKADFFLLPVDLVKHLPFEKWPVCDKQMSEPGFDSVQLLRLIDGLNARVGGQEEALGRNHAAITEFGRIINHEMTRLTALSEFGKVMNHEMGSLAAVVNNTQAEVKELGIIMNRELESLAAAVNNTQAEVKEYGKVMNNEMESLASEINNAQLAVNSLPMNDASNAPDVEEVFANGGAGLSVLIKCFFIWIKYKLNGKGARRG